MSKPFSFQPKPVNRAVGILIALMATSSALHAGPGFVDAKRNNGAAFREQTYFANSPAGNRATAVPEAASLNTGTALRKFVDPLPLFGDTGASKYLPQAVNSKWITPEGKATNDDYIELAVVEYQEKFHSDLANQTTLRGFVQIDVEASNGRTSAIANSKSLALKDAQGNDLMILATDAYGKLVKGTDGKYVKVQAKAVDAPHYLGPVVNATSGVPMRIKLHNLLPAGRAVATGAGDAAVISKRNGDHFLPVDTTVLGAGLGPDNVTTYTQNRVNLHVQGADAPWISAGSPHQWFTPAGEYDAAAPGTLAYLFATNTQLDPTYLDSYLRGASLYNVPDMNDPGPGAATYYFANNQGARMLWASDRTMGLSRQNTLAGMAFPYVITDPAEAAMVASGVLPPAARTLPIILQDRTFVPQDIALQDAKWNTSAWGGESSLWMPHVYEYLSNPAFQNNWDPAGRWAYGPTFWPIFPAQQALPSGSYGDPSFTPEAYFDTSVVNGAAYPTTEVEPTTYRLRIVNASNDRWMTFNLFEGKVTASLADGTPVTNPFDIKSEVDMVQATAPLPDNACAAGETRPTLVNGVWCTPETWPVDSRMGGVAAPSAVGPSLVQIANEAGWLGKVPTIDPTPLFYITDKGRVTVLNPDTPALFLAPGEAADVVVDFSQYAGKSLLAYNDAGGPEPGADPRNFYFTGVGDQSSAGGAEDTKPGYGPNVRTLMQFNVKAEMTDKSAITAFDPAELVSALTATYYGDGTTAAGQDRPIVAQPEYSTFDSTWTGIIPGPAVDGTATAYGDIFVGSLKNPRFTFVPGDPSAAFNGAKVTTAGSGYSTAPSVSIDGGGGTGALASASLKISAAIFSSHGSGYTSAPTVQVGTPTVGQGSGATATAWLAPDTVKITAGGTGYTQAAVDAAIAAGSFAVFSAQPKAVAPTVASATVNAVSGAITAITLVAGSNYSVVPSIAITGGGGSGARGSVTASIGSLTFDSAYPTTPTATGGGGYTDLTSVALTFGGGGIGAVAPTVTVTGSLFDVSVTDSGTGYTSTPSITLSGGGGSGAAAQFDTADGSVLGSMLPKTKSIQELFEPAAARYNSTQGVEIPYTSANTQTTIPLGYIDTPTEYINEGDTQIWKYTHNGLFGQPVEFGGYSVQVVNRAGWDNFVTGPQANEFGWKNVVRMQPLEDILLALKPKRSKLSGFGLPTSVRLMDPTQPWGSPFNFTQFDPATGLSATIVNDYVDFRWENTLSNTVASRNAVDFNRPVIYNPKESAPLAPTDVAATSDSNGLKVTWTDATPAGVNSTQGEVGFRVQVGTEGSTAWTDLPTDLHTLNGLVADINTLANATQYLDTSVQNAPPPSTPNAPTARVQSPRQVQIRWVVPNNGPSSIVGYRILRATVAPDGIALGPFLDLGVSLAGSDTRFTDTSAEPAVAYQYEVVAVGANGGNVIYRVVAVNAVGESPSAPSAAVNSTGIAQSATSQPSATVATPIAAPTLPSPDIVLSNVGTTYHATLNFNVVDGAGSYLVSYRVGNSPTGGNWTTPVSQTGLSKDVTLNLNQYITFRVTAVSTNLVNNQAVQSTRVTSSTVREAIPATPTGLALANVTTTSLVLNWAGTTDASYTVQRATNAAFTANLVSTPSNGLATSLAVAGLTPNTQYYFRVVATNGLGSSANSASSNAWTLVNAVAAAPTAAAVATTTLTLNWTPSAGGATSYLVQRATNATFTAGLVATTVAGNLSSLNVTGLTANSTYYYRVIAVSGSGVQAAPSPTLTQLEVPVAPGTPTIAANSTTASGLTLNWTAVAGLNYTLQYATDAAFTAGLGSLSAGPFNNTAGSKAVTGLNGNTPYWFRLVAVNAAGSSAPSTTVNAWTLANPVTAAPTVSNGTATALTLNWVAPANGGAASYTVQRSTNAGFTGAGVNNTPVTGATTLAVTGLTANTTYYFRVVARNGAPQPVQASASPVLTVLTVPAAVNGVQAVRGINNGVISGGLSWTNVNGVTYEVQWADSNAMTGATLVSPATNGGQITITGGARNVFMQVRAVNASGPGAWSNVTTVGAR